MTILGKKISLPIEPYVNPLEDSTALDTIFFTDADKVRFDNNKLRKIHGWQRIFSNNAQRIIGAARNIFSYRDQNNTPLTIIGTHHSLYVLLQSTNIINITPLLTQTNSIANAISTEYNVGALITVTTVNGSSTVTLNITQFLNDNEEIQISGVVGTINGIPATNFNNTFNAYVLNNNQIQINVGANATSSGSVVVTMTWATSYLYVQYNNFGYLKGDRVKILASAQVANILAVDINIENIISNVVNNDIFTIQTPIIANADVVNGGGGSTTIQFQIPEGNTNQSIGFGYGGGQFGAANFGESAQFTDQSINSNPRIWSMDKYVDSSYVTYLVLTPGDAAGSADGSGANVYKWTSDVTVAPTLITNAPYFVQWLYVSHNSICTLGGAPASLTPSQGIPNFFSSSDIANITIWTPAVSNYAYQVTIDKSNALISQASTRNVDLIFTNDEVIRAVFVDKPDIWFFDKLFTTDGIIAPKARTEIQDRVYWQGEGDFFVTDGTSVEIIPNNTLKRFVYDNINFSQASKCFAYANTLYNEVWFFWLRGQDIEPNNYAMYNYKSNTWVTGTLPRTASEEPLNINNTPLMIQSNFQSTLTPNSIQSYFLNLENNPLTTTNTSKNIGIVVNTTCFLNVGDYIQVSGATTTNGIPAGEINGIKQIVAVSLGLGGYGSGDYGVGLYGISSLTYADIVIQSVSTAATSTGTGGGNAITIGTAVLGLDLGVNSGRVDVGEVITVQGAPAVDGFSTFYTNVINARIRAIAGTVIEINNSAPTTQFSTSAATVTNTNGFVINYEPSDRLFQQEVGLNDYNSNYIYGSSTSTDAPMLSYATTNMAQIGDGDETMVIYSVYPDTSQVGNLTLTVNGKLYPQGISIPATFGTTTGTYTITPNTTKVDLMFLARQRQYTITSNVIDGNFLIGKWYEEVKPSSTR